MKLTRVRLQIATCVALAAVLVAASSASAALVTYTIRPDLSFSNVSGDGLGGDSTFGGALLTPQLPGSEVAPLSGTITGDLVGGSLDLTGQLSLIDVVSPWGLGTFVPAPIVRTTDDFALSAPAIATFLTYGNFSQTLGFGTLVDGSPVLGTGVEIEFLAGTVVELMSPFVGGGAPTPLPITGGPVIVSPGLFTIATVGLTETITIPVSTIDDFGGGTVLRSFGVIVAERTIPEPSTLVLAGLGAIGLAYVVRRRK